MYPSIEFQVQDEGKFLGSAKATFSDGDNVHLSGDLQIHQTKVNYSIHITLKDEKWAILSDPIIVGNPPEKEKDWIFEKVISAFEKSDQMPLVRREAELSFVQGQIVSLEDTIEAMNEDIRNKKKELLNYRHRLIELT